MKWVGYAAHTDKQDTHTAVWMEDHNGREHLGDLGIDERSILICIYKK
jgi:hypothetical protein